MESAARVDYPAQEHAQGAHRRERRRRRVRDFGYAHEGDGWFGRESGDGLVSAQPGSLIPIESALTFLGILLRLRETCHIYLLPGLMMPVLATSRFGKGSSGEDCISCMSSILDEYIDWPVDCLGDFGGAFVGLPAMASPDAHRLRRSTGCRRAL